MEMGDLVYIPQGVEMWRPMDNGMKMIITDKPVTGVFIKHDTRHIYQVYTNAEWQVQKKHVYPMEGTC